MRLNRPRKVSEYRRVHMSHPIRPKEREGVVRINWPSYRGTATLVGKSPSGRVTVYVDASLGQQVLTNAQALIAQGDSVCNQNDSIFGTKGGNVNVVIFALGGQTDGTGGADHASCNYQTGNNIEVCASFGRNDRILALFEAELSECSMGGNLCGVSTGEALSRWCANVIAPHALDDFASAPVWYQDGMVNWVDTTEDTDQDYDSIGCGMAFLSWLVSLGHPLTNIAQAMVKLQAGGTLAQLFVTLAGGSLTGVWTSFSTAIRAISNGVISDDPFAGSVPPPPPPGGLPTTLVALDTNGKELGRYALLSSEFEATWARLEARS